MKNCKNWTKIVRETLFLDFISWIDQCEVPIPYTESYFFKWTLQGKTNSQTFKWTGWFSELDRHSTDYPTSPLTGLYPGQSHYREVPWWEIFMEQELRYGLDLGQMADFSAFIAFWLKKPSYTSKMFLINVAHFDVSKTYKILKKLFKFFIG